MDWSNRAGWGVLAARRAPGAEELAAERRQLLHLDRIIDVVHCLLAVERLLQHHFPAATRRQGILSPFELLRAVFDLRTAPLHNCEAVQGRARV